MANNYTTNYPTTTEFPGDSVGAGTIQPTYDIIVTPDTGYTVQASDFFIGSSLPAEVTQVVFTDTTTALDPTNKVRARVHLASWYTMPAVATSGYSGVIVEVDIDGRTHQWKPRLQFTTTSTNINNLTETFTSAGTLTSSAVDTLVTNTVSYDIPQDVRTAVLQTVFTADSGYFIPSIPSFRIVSSDLARWSSATTGKVYNSDNQLTSITFTLYYNIGSQNIDYSVGENIIWIIPEVEADTASRTSIYSAYFLGLPNQSVLPPGDTTLQLFVSGSENSTYNVKVEDSIERTYDFSSNDGTFSRSLTTSGEQTIYSPTEQILRSREMGRNQHLITIPYLVRKDTSGTGYYRATITPTGSTTTGSSGASTDPFVITLNQFGVVDTSVAIKVSTYGVDTTSRLILNLDNQPAISYPTTFNPTDFPTLSTSNNGFFSIADDLGYTIDEGVASHSHPSASVVLDSSSAALKLQTGDSVTGTGIDTDTTITVDGTTTIVLSKTSTEAITGTLRFTRTVGISRQPVISDFDITAPLSITSGWSAFDTNVVQASSNSTTVVVGSTTGLVVGMTVQSNNIVGYPTIVSVSSNSIILSTSQTLFVGDILIFTPAMGELYISEMSVSGAGTTSCKLNVEGYIQRVGNNDIQSKLILDNFVTTYVGPVAANLTATCVHGESISISPIPDCTGHTGNLTINTVTKGGGDGATISGDKQTIIYTAPSSGTVDTPQYTISDGINISASKTITITLISS